ncbi:hypothetical protein BU24DRAFT_152190 [Aaosphaeria arxii CBS 175.79]|uniref:Mid2 domain-containing protein n=1 Tax=Aaosphaeria arxii CBS 175.79 TaxID=1450172 RepID=A0A6A5XX97_9PLEO|nr:uncharacterized protein BU24DRAFT_152190 [Aaosphaeria arxii CBS 175.79]KAF2017533.1 hypothetical protein BU24DRAFT_152190 [Aaosphaeria arxii CBS 175.79]
MICDSRTVVRLCWTFILLLPLVQCQLGDSKFGGGGFGGDQFSPESGFGVGKPFPNNGFGGGGGGGGGFKKGNGFAQNFQPSFDKQRGSQFGGQGRGSFKDNNNDVKTLLLDDEASSSRAVAMPRTSRSISAAPATKTPVSNMPMDSEDEEKQAAAPPEENESLPPTSSFLRPVVPTPEAASSAISTAIVPETQILQGPSSSSFAAPSFLSAIVPTPSSTTVITVSETVVVTPTPFAPVPAASALPDAEQSQSAASSPPSPTSDQSLAAQSTSSTEMSASARAGVGVGVTLGIIGIASVTGLYLYRRRKNRLSTRKGGEISSSQHRRWGGGFGFKRYFMLSRGKNTPKDTEWSIESAAHVEIVRGANARTISRSDSNSNSNRDDTPPPPTREEGVLKVGMTVPIVERYYKNPALTSNPPSLPNDSPLSPSAFPKPPRTYGNNINTKHRNDKTGSWPLPD